MFSRTEILIGGAGVERLQKSTVAVIGLGGVGGHIAESLARAGVGTLILCDGDEVSQSNLNRQILALHSTLGQNKAIVAANRVKDINPKINVTTFCDFVSGKNIDSLNLKSCDCVADAIDSVDAKLDLIEYCVGAKIPIISSMGAGNRLIPRFEATDIYTTHSCPLAKVVRKELRSRGIGALRVVYSPFPPTTIGAKIGSISYVTATAGMLMSCQVVECILDKD